LGDQTHGKPPKNAVVLRERSRSPTSASIREPCGKGQHIITAVHFAVPAWNPEVYSQEAYTARTIIGLAIRPSMVWPLFSKSKLPENGSQRWEIAEIASSNGGFQKVGGESRSSTPDLLWSLSWCGYTGVPDPAGIAGKDSVGRRSRQSTAARTNEAGRGRGSTRARGRANRAGGSAHDGDHGHGGHHYRLPRDNQGQGVSEGGLRLKCMTGACLKALQTAPDGRDLLSSGPSGMKS